MARAPVPPRAVLAIATAAALLLAAEAASARPRPIASSSEAPGAASKRTTDLYWFGGTHWDAADARWEANMSLSRENAWTFDSGVGGPLEGWTGRDRTEVPLPTRPLGNPDNADFRWTHSALYALYGTPGTNLFPTATPPDTGGIWCSKYEVEADELCYVAGQGYGTLWDHEARKEFAYGGTGDARMTFRYWNNTEKGYDYTYLYLEFNGVRETGPRSIMFFTLGSPASKRTRTVTISATTIPPGTSTIAAVFRFTSDSGWSDEDGVGHTTVYGAFCCYNFIYEDIGTPANGDVDSFETGPDGWTFHQKVPIGDFVEARPLAGLPDPAVPCDALSGNVLTFFDDSGGVAHPPKQDAMAVSPVIDLAEAGLADAASKFAVADAYMDLPLSNAVYYKIWLRAYPVLCEATGLLIEDDIAPDPFIHRTAAPACFDESALEDFSSVAGDIEYCSIGIEILERCSFSTACTSPGGNTTPWFDNVRLGVGDVAVGVDPGPADLPAAPELTVSPNPSRPGVTLEYAVATAGPVTLRIYDVRGALVATLVDAVRAAGRYEAVWSGADVAGRAAPAGVYWAQLTADGRAIARRLVVLR